MGLVLVLAVMAMLAWGLRRGTRVRMVSGAGLETLGALSLGASERVVLIRAGDKHLLLGVAPGSVQTLHVLDAIPLSRVEAETNTQPQGFARYLTAALARNRAR